jgi:uncharacterized protein (DUF2147 family)
MALHYENPYLGGMKYRSLLTLALALLAHPVSAQRAAANPPASGSSPVGVWLTQDHGGIIAIAGCEDRLCARIVGVVLDHPNDTMPVDYRGLSQCGLTLISDARQVKPGLWKGHILDPRNGGVFGVDLTLDPSGRLLLRGFLGVPLLGRTETWTRYTGVVPADCRLLAVRHSTAEHVLRPGDPG